MKKIQILLLIFQFSFLAKAQSTFERTYSQGFNSTYFNSILNWKDSIYILELSEFDGACNYSGHLRYFNSNGSVIGGASIPNAYTSHSIGNTTKGLNNNYFSICSDDDCSLDTTLLCIANLNVSGTPIWSSTHPFNFSSINFSQIIPTSDGGCIFSYQLNNSSSILYAIKYNLLGVPVFTKMYNSIYSVSGMTNSQNRIYVTAKILNSNNILNEALITYSINMDSICTHFISNDSIIAIRKLIFCTDSNIAFIGSISDSVNTWKSCVGKIDSTGVVLWKNKSRLKGYYSDISQYPDGELVASFIKHKNNSYAVDKSYIFRYDYNGDSLFATHYNTYSETAIWSVETTNAHGYVACGNIDSGWAAYILRADSLGFTTSRFDLSEMSDIVIYPNPASTEINITTKEKSGANKIKIINLHGEIMIEKLIKLTDQSIALDVSELNDGFYICNLYLNTNLVKRSNFAIIKNH